MNCVNVKLLYQHAVQVSISKMTKRQEKRNRKFRKTTKKERAQPWRADWGCDQMAPAGAKKARSNTKNTPKEKILSKN